MEKMDHLIFDELPINIVISCDFDSHVNLP